MGLLIATSFGTTLLYAIGAYGVLWSKLKEPSLKTLGIVKNVSIFITAWGSATAAYLLITIAAALLNANLHFYESNDQLFKAYDFAYLVFSSVVAYQMGRLLANRISKKIPALPTTPQS